MKLNRRLSAHRRWPSPPRCLSSLAGCEGTGTPFVPDADWRAPPWRRPWRLARRQAVRPDRGDSAHPRRGFPWQNGEQIASFEIGDEQADADGTKQFPVKLTLKKGGKVQEVRYIVNGRDPVWIFSETDYKRMIDMGNGKATGAAEVRETPSSAGEHGGRGTPMRIRVDGF